MSTQTVLDVVLQTEGKLRENVKQDACRWNSTSKIFEYWNGSTWTPGTEAVGSVFSLACRWNDGSLEYRNSSVWTTISKESLLVLNACKWNTSTKHIETWGGSSWSSISYVDALTIGTIQASILPLSDTRLQLLDGSSLAKSSFPEFWDYVNSQSSSSSDFLTEANWQTWNTAHGQCPKFVLETDSVRIPNLTGSAIAGEIDASARYYIVVKSR